MFKNSWLKIFLIFISNKFGTFIIIIIFSVKLFLAIKLYMLYNTKVKIMVKTNNSLNNKKYWSVYSYDLSFAIQEFNYMYTALFLTI